MSKSNFLEDFSLGQRIIHAIPRTISEGDAAVYLSLTGDRRPLFCSQTFALQLGHKKNPINDLLLFHVAFGKTVQDITLTSIATFGYAAVSFNKPDDAGDTIRCASMLIVVQETAKQNH